MAAALEEAKTVKPADSAPKTKLEPPKGSYNTDHFESIGITTCPHCGDKEGVSCSEGYSEEVCPMLKSKPKNTL
jgi:hypothetical protein